MGRVFSYRLYMATKGLSPFAHKQFTKPLEDDINSWLKFISNFISHSLWQHEFVEFFTVVYERGRVMWVDVFFNGHWSAVMWQDCWQQLGFTRNTVLLELFPVLVSVVI